MSEWKSPGYFIDLIDVCSLQWPIDFQKVKDCGIRGVYVKASQYSSTADHRFGAIVEGFTKLGVPCGAYHFCAQNFDGKPDTPEKQAEFFWRMSDGLGKNPGELPPMLDWEFCTADKPKKHCVHWLERAAARAKELWYPHNSRMPVVYTYPNYSDQHQPELSQSHELDTYPLCYASYRGTGATRNPSYAWYPAKGSNPDHKLPKPWDKWTLWQYSGNWGIKVPGIAADCDRQVFNGTEEDYQLFLGNSPTNRPGGIQVFPVIDDTFLKTVKTEIDTWH